MIAANMKIETRDAITGISRGSRPNISRDVVSLDGAYAGADMARNVLLGCV